jgi:hypothetical protein
VGSGLSEHLEVTGQLTTIRTQFFVIKIRKGGTLEKPNSQVEITSRPAFEVALLSRDNDNNVCVQLMTKQRLEGSAAPWRGLDVEKFTGGYCTDNKDQLTWGFVQDRIKALTGYVIDLDSCGVVGCVVGHTEVEFPIALLYATRWEVVDEPPAGVKVFTATLEQAKHLAWAALQREMDNSLADNVSPIPQCLENDTGLEIVFGLERALPAGHIPI